VLAHLHDCSPFLVLAHVAKWPGIEARFLWQLEYPLRDDVALDFVGPARDRYRRHRYEDLRDDPVARALTPGQHRGGPGHHRMNAGARSCDMARGKLAQRSLGALRTPLALRGAGATRGPFRRLRQDHQLGDLLADVRVAIRTGLPG